MQHQQVLAGADLPIMGWIFTRLNLFVCHRRLRYSASTSLMFDPIHSPAGRARVLECWSVPVPEYWGLHDSITPLLRSLTLAPPYAIAESLLCRTGARYSKPTPAALLPCEQSP